MEVFFISGHINLTQGEFDIHYKPAIDDSLKKNGRYVLGNAAGADTMALDYLLKKGVDPHNITIYFYDKYKRDLTKKYTDRGIQVQMGFTSYTNRDAKMTEDSTIDILWVRPRDEAIKLLGSEYKEGHMTGTERNFLRRQNKK